MVYYMLLNLKVIVLCFLLCLQEEEENFVLTALFVATEEGNIEGIKELVETAENFDINQHNKVRWEKMDETAQNFNIKQHNRIRSVKWMKLLRTLIL